VMREMEGKGFSVASANVDASLHGPEFALDSRVRGANVSFSGYHTYVDSSAFDLALTGHTFSTSARISGLTVSSRKDGAQNSWLEADFPSAQAAASGTRAGWNSLAGTLHFRMVDGEQSVFSMDRPLRFSTVPPRSPQGARFLCPSRLWKCSKV
jgi:hypothetical protein